MCSVMWSIDAAVWSICISKYACFVYNINMVFLVKDACLFVLYLILSYGVKLSLPAIGAGVII